MSDDLSPATPRTLTTLRRLASMKGYLPPKPAITEAEAKLAITALARLKSGPDGRALRLPAVPEQEVPGTTLRGWFTKRP